ncbi:MAG TPA: Crp/Fnr family transcriptional regulator [Bradyrhizobium sp.]|nr:Crp/Fnr family transcriptional regulator [Bradyrhizobium sp.]
MGTLDLRLVLNGQSAGLTRETYAAGETISQQGDPAPTLHYIEHGLVAVSIILQAGKETIAGVCRPGDFLALRALLGGGPRRTSSVTLTECTILQIEKSLANRLLRERPEFAGLWTDFLLRQHLRDLKRIVIQSYPAKERLRQTLLEISSLNDSDNSEPIKITQTTLANLVGTTRPRVSFFMRSFRRQGLIEYDRAGTLIVRKTLGRALQRRGQAI